MRCAMASSNSNGLSGMGKMSKIFSPGNTYVSFASSGSSEWSADASATRSGAPGPHGYSREKSSRAAAPALTATSCVFASPVPRTSTITHVAAAAPDASALVSRRSSLSWRPMTASA
eukprot:scaffold235751_cov24-Tisochrysis_lutea.AAC.3